MFRVERQVVGALCWQHVLAAAVIALLPACGGDEPQDELHNCIVQSPSRPEFETPMRLSMGPFTYPPEALSSITDVGGVILEFSLDVDGRPFDIDAAVACPTGLFEVAAVRDFASAVFATPSGRALENRHWNRVIYRIEDVTYPDQLEANCKQRAEETQMPVACYF